MRNLALIGIAPPSVEEEDVFPSAIQLSQLHVPWDRSVIRHEKQNFKASTIKLYRSEQWETSPDFMPLSTHDTGVGRSSSTPVAHNNR